MTDAMTESSVIDLTPLSTPAASTALVPMPSTYVYQPQPQERNALFKKPPPRRRAAPRNAAPVARRRDAAPAAPKVKDTSRGDTSPKTGAARIGQSIITALVSGGSSIGGALAARWGAHPYAVAGIIGGAGLVTSWLSERESVRQVGTGLMSTGLAQVMLMAFMPDPKPAPPAPPPAATPGVNGPGMSSPPARLKNSDLGTMPPGWLDAAFEQARAELAQASAPSHHTIPFVP